MVVSYLALFDLTATEEVAKVFVLVSSQDEPSAYGPCKIPHVFSYM